MSVCGRRLQQLVVFFSQSWRRRGNGRWPRLSEWLLAAAWEGNFLEDVCLEKVDTLYMEEKTRIGLQKGLFVTLTDSETYSQDLLIISRRMNEISVKRIMNQLAEIHTRSNSPASPINWSN